MAVNTTNFVLPLDRPNPPVGILELSNGLFSCRAVQQLPQVRTTYWNMHGTGLRSEIVACPYTAFTVIFMRNSIDTRNLRVYFSNSPITDRKSMLYHTNFPNLYQDDRVCIGKVSIDKTQSKERQIESLIDQFWKNHFIEHLLDNHFTPSRKLHVGISSIKTWAKASLMKKSFILTVNWRPAMTLEEAMVAALNSYKISNQETNL